VTAYTALMDTHRAVKTANINVKKRLFVTMCEAHSKVTHIKKQKYFYHLKDRGYNKDCVLHPRPFS